MSESIKGAPKRQWFEPTLEIIANVADVASSGIIDVDEDFTGTAPS